MRGQHYRYGPVELDEAALAAAAQQGRNGPKVALIRILHRYQIERGMRLNELGKAGGISWATLSRLYSGKLADASTDRLLAVLATLGLHVDLKVDFDPAPQNRGVIDIYVHQSEECSAKVENSAG